MSDIDHSWTYHREVQSHNGGKDNSISIKHRYYIKYGHYRAQEPLHLRNNTIKISCAHSFLSIYDQALAQNHCSVGYFVCVFLGGFRPTREFFTHMETSALPMKSCTFGPMLGTHGH